MCSGDALHEIPAYAALEAPMPLAPFSIERLEPGPREVPIDILYCGACHCDVHQAQDDVADINTACERMLKGDVRYRFAIDLASLRDGT